MPKPQLHKAARLEISQAAARYREDGRRQHNDDFGKQLAAEFRAEVRHCIDTVLERPMQWPAYGHGTQRRILERFPFSIIYEQVHATLQAASTTRLGWSSLRPVPRGGCRGVLAGANAVASSGPSSGLALAIVLDRTVSAQPSPAHRQAGAAPAAPARGALKKFPDPGVRSGSVPGQTSRISMTLQQRHDLSAWQRNDGLTTVECYLGWLAAFALAEPLVAEVLAHKPERAPTSDAVLDGLALIPDRPPSNANAQTRWIVAVERVGMAHRAAADPRAGVPWEIRDALERALARFDAGAAVLWISPLGRHPPALARRAKSPVLTRPGEPERRFLERRLSELATTMG